MPLPANPIALEFRFAPTQSQMPSAISRYLNTTFSEQSETPIYYHYKRANWRGKTYLALFYMIFYAHNPGYKPFRLCGIGKSLGEHAADIEHLVILFENEDLTKPAVVYFGAHGTGQGQWVAWDKCEKNSEGALRLYVSPTSHAMYPKPGCYLRIFGFANDVTTKKGASWTPAPADFVHSHDQSWSDSHYQVARGINTPKNMSEPASTSITPHERFLMALPAIRKKLKVSVRIQATLIRE